MPVTPVFCSGRDWCNAPADARTGTSGRGPPRWFKIKWTNGILCFAADAGTDQILEYDGVPVPGNNAGANWNWIDAIGSNNINAIQSFDGSRFRWLVTFTCLAAFQLHRTRYLSIPYTWFEWQAGVPIQTTFFNFDGPQRIILDDELFFFPALYADVGAGACLPQY